jgi:proteasome accessory factor A
LVLDLIEDGWTSPLDLNDPVAAFKLISRGHDLMATVALSGGRVVRAVDVQRQYLEAAARSAAGRDSETDWVLQQWGAALQALESDPTPFADRIDWLAKRRLFEQLRGAGAGAGEGGAGAGGWDNPALRRLDLAYHLLDPALSLYEALLKQGRMHRLVTDEQVTRALTSGPAGTRGAVRALLLNRFGPAIRRLEWDSVTFGSNGREVRLQLDEISGPLVRRVEQLAREAPDLESLFTAMKGGNA